MGRPRKGVVQRPDGHWTVSLPIAVSSKQTRQFTDPDETAVRRWFADGERALAAGNSLPDPDSYRTNRPAPALTALALGDRTPAHWWAGPTAAFGHRFDKVAEAFLVHHYDRQRSGQPERRGAVVAVIDNDLKPFLARHQVPVIEAITHELVGKLAAHLAAVDAAEEMQAEPWPELNGRTEITLTEAAALPGTSRPTVKRWYSAGLLPSWHRDPLDGQVWIRGDELRVAHQGGRGAAAARKGNQATTARNKLNVLKMILNFAEANGIQLTGKPMQGISAVHPEGAPPRRSKNPHVPLALFGRIAAHLPVVHQLTMWLERLLGVRISEGFGPHVGDVLDFGAGLGGAIVLDRQGGKPFLVRVGGRIVVADEKDRMKNEVSNRVIRLPRQLMDLIRVVIEAFHTDPVTGEVDLEARLIPGLRAADRSGQSAHREALKTAIAAAEIDTELYGTITPHELRAHLATDLDRAGVEETLAPLHRPRRR
jgi:integrase